MSVGASPHNQTPTSCNAPDPTSGEAAPMALRCLIIDDSFDVLAALAASVESDGVEVVATARGRTDGIARAVELQPDGILIDVDLGDDSGPQVAQELTALGVSAAIILISAYRNYAELAEGTQVLGFLSKTDISRAAIEQLMTPSPDDQ